MNISGKRPRKVWQWDTEGNLIDEYPSMHDAAFHLRTSASNIVHAIKNRSVVQRQFILTSRHCFEPDTDAHSEVD